MNPEKPEPKPDAIFRPSNLHRMKLCHGSWYFETSLMETGVVSETDESRYAQEGRLLHERMADPGIARNDLNPEQFETVEKCEAMEKEFLEKISPK